MFYIKKYCPYTLKYYTTIEFLYFKLAQIHIKPTEKKEKKIFEKERQIVLLHFRSTETQLSNVVFGKSTRAIIRFPKLN